MKPVVNDQKPLPVIKRKEMPERNSTWTVSRQIRSFQAGIRNIQDRMLTVPFVRLIVGTVEGAGSHDVGQRAAGVAYYAILSVFPLLLGLIAVFGFFLPSVNLQDALLKYVGTSIPGATNILKDNITEIIRLRGVMSLLSIIILFVGGSALFGAVSLAINRCWEFSIKRSFLIRKAGELVMAIVTGALFLISLGASSLSSVMRGVINLPSAERVVINVGSRVIAFLLILIVFLLLYKLVPYAKTRWRDIWQGALMAALLFELARSIFIFYLEHFANYQLIYGSIASIIALLVWIYYSSFIMILGAEFTFQYTRLNTAVTAVNSTAK
jgi:membrane protein